MAIRAGQILHVANQFVVDRIQTGGPGQLNIPQERIYELGNYRSVGIVRDLPDLSFSLECLDVDTELEALLTGVADPSAEVDGAEYDLSLNKAIDIISPWKTPYGAYTAVKGVAIPALVLESASYRYGLRDNAGETFSLRGDSIYYVPGTPKQDIFAGDGATTAFAFTETPALAYTSGGTDTYALSVLVDGVRKFLGDDYTETNGGITFLTAPDNGAVVSVVYGHGGTDTYAQTVHEGLSVKPAAIKGKDIDVYFATSVPVGGGISNVGVASNVVTVDTTTAHGLSVGDSVVVDSSVDAVDGTVTVATVVDANTFTYAKTTADVASAAATGTVKAPVEVRWTDVQSATLEWRITLEDDYEFGNPKAVDRSATDVPAVTGAIEVKPRTVDAFFTKLRQITGVDDVAKIMGPNSSVAGALRIELRNPESGGTTAVPAGTVLKTHYLPAVRFTMPGYEGRVQQKLSVTLNYESDDGVLLIYKGAPA